MAKNLYELDNEDELILGEIGETVNEFRDRLSQDSPVGFVAVDVDIYSSAKSPFAVVRW